METSGESKQQKLPFRVTIQVQLPSAPKGSNGSLYLSRFSVITRYFFKPNLRKAIIVGEAVQLTTFTFKLYEFVCISLQTEAWKTLSKNSSVKGRCWDWETGSQVICVAEVQFSGNGRYLACWTPIGNPTVAQSMGLCLTSQAWPRIRGMWGELMIKKT